MTDQNNPTRKHIMHRPNNELILDILEYLGDLEVGQYHSVYDEMGLEKIKGIAEILLERE